VSPSGSLVGDEFPIVTEGDNDFCSPISFDGSKFLMIFNNGDSPYDDATHRDVYGVFVSEVAPCEGDFDLDGDVDGSDLAVFAAEFGRTDCSGGSPCEGDFDRDGDVDGSDLAVFAADFGKTDCP